MRFMTWGNRVKAIADEAADAGHDVTAGSAYWRAFTYYRSAERVLSGKDPRKLPMYERCIECFLYGYRFHAASIRTYHHPV